MIITKGKQKYFKLGKRAIPFNKVDKQGRPIITPQIIKKKNKKGSYDITVKIPCLKIKYKKNV